MTSAPPPPPGMLPGESLKPPAIRPEPDLEPTPAPAPTPTPTPTEVAELTPKTSDTRDDDERIALLRAAAAWYVEALGVTVVAGHYPIDGDKLECSCGDGDECRHPAKHPVSAWTKSYNHVKFAEDVQRVWTDKPWNIFVVLGPRQGVFVFDVDPRNGGDESFVELKHTLSGIIDFDTTYRYNTSRGGSHYYFRVSADDLESWSKISQLATNIRKGIEFKHSLSYVVAAPSRHISGEFYHRPAGSTMTITELSSDDVDRLYTALKASKNVGKSSSKTSLTAVGSLFAEDAGFAELAQLDSSRNQDILAQLRSGKEISDGLAARAVLKYKAFKKFDGERKLEDGEGRNNIWFSLALRFVSDYMSRDPLGWQDILDSCQFDYSTDRGVNDIPPGLLHEAKEFSSALFDPPYHTSNEYGFTRGIRTAIRYYMKGQ